MAQDLTQEVVRAAGRKPLILISYEYHYFVT